MSPYQRGPHFPHEQFVQETVERYFAELGYDRLVGGLADYRGVHPQTAERWMVEAKGKTSAVGTDFHTGLGQLLKRMTDGTWRYGVVMPDIGAFRSQCQQVSPWALRQLRIHWLWVSECGKVTIESA